MKQFGPAYHFLLANIVGLIFFIPNLNGSLNERISYPVGGLRQKIMSGTAQLPSEYMDKRLPLRRSQVHFCKGFPPFFHSKMGYSDDSRVNNLPRPNLMYVYSSPLDPLQDNAHSSRQNSNSL